MDAEFQRILLRVMAVGGAIGIIGAGGLVVAFRAFAGRGFRAAILVVSVIAFVLVVCGALFLLSVR